MLTVLQLVDCLWIELNLTQNRVLAFLGRKQHVHMEIEWTLALANLILHPNDLEMVRRFDALIGAHKIHGGLADKRRTHHIRHKLRIRPLVLLLRFEMVHPILETTYFHSIHYVNDIQQIRIFPSTNAIDARSSL